MTSNHPSVPTCSGGVKPADSPSIAPVWCPSVGTLKIGGADPRFGGGEGDRLGPIGLVRGPQSDDHPLVKSPRVPAPGRTARTQSHMQVRTAALAYRSEAIDHSAVIRADSMGTSLRRSVSGRDGVRSPKSEARVIPATLSTVGAGPEGPASMAAMGMPASR
jgi:hypothetical protein